MPAKKWWQSKTIWSDIITVLIALYGSIAANIAPDLGIHLKPLPATLLTILGLLGLYGRKTATTQIDQGLV